MRLELKTAPATPAITLQAIKDYGYDNASENDTLISTEIAAVTDYVELITGRRLINQSWYIYLDANEYFDRLLAYKDSITLSTLNVSSITEVTTYDRSNNGTVITASDYRLSGTVLSASSKLVFNDDYPQPINNNLRRVDSVRIEVVAGYGAAISNIPQTIQDSMAILANHWVQFGMRMMPDGSKPTPLNFEAKLLSYKSTETWY